MESAPRMGGEGGSRPALWGALVDEDRSGEDDVKES